MDLKSVLVKVKDFFKKVKLFLNKSFGYLIKYGFGVANFLVLFALYSGAHGNLSFPNGLLAIGGLWILFIAGRFMYKIWDGSLFNNETD
jgi:hypothetical protein